jgi:two-component system nitrogen regulation response regulator GlnG
VLLLRALETGTVRAVGGRHDRSVDVRVIAATDADLEGGVAEGRFRGPLLHRLAGFVLPVAALNDRREDIGVLATHFALGEQAALGGDATPDPQRPHLPAAFIAALARSDLSGNVRQLKNIIRQWVILQRDGASGVDWRPLVPRATPTPPSTTGPTPAMPRRSYRSADDVTEDELVEAMRAHRYQAKAAATALGISRTALYGLLERSTRIRKATTLTVAEIEAAAAQHGNEPTAMADALGVSRPALLRRMSALGLR